MDEALTLLSTGLSSPQLLEALQRAKDEAHTHNATRSQAAHVWNSALAIRDLRTFAAARDLGLALMRASAKDELLRGVLDDESFVQLLSMTTLTARAFWKAAEVNMASSLIADAEALASRAPRVMARRLALQRDVSMAMHVCTRLLLIRPPSKRAVSAILESVRATPLGIAKDQLMAAVSDAAESTRGLDVLPVLVECIAAWDRSLALAVGAHALECCMDRGSSEHATACASVLRAHPALSQTRPGRVLDALRILSTGGAPSDVATQLCAGGDATDVLSLARVAGDCKIVVDMLSAACGCAASWSAEDAMSVASELLCAGCACETDLLVRAVSSAVNVLSRYSAVWPKVPTVDAQRLLVGAARRLYSSKRWTDALRAIDAVLAMAGGHAEESVGEILENGADALCDELGTEERIMAEARTLHARILVRLGRFTEAERVDGTSVAVRLEIMLATGDEDGARRSYAEKSASLTEGEVLQIAQLFESFDQKVALSVLCEHFDSVDVAIEALVLISKIGSEWDQALVLVDKVVADGVRRKLLNDSAEVSSRALDAAWNAALDMQDGGQHAMARDIARECLRVAGRGSRAAMFCALYLQNALLMDEEDRAMRDVAERCLAVIDSVDLDADARSAVSDLCNAAFLAVRLVDGESLESIANAASDTAVEIALAHHLRTAQHPCAASIPQLLKVLASRSVCGPDAAGLARFATLLRGQISAAAVELADGNTDSGRTILDLISIGCEVVQTSVNAFPFDETAWLCASAYNAALKIMRSGRLQSDIPVTLARQALMLCTCLPNGPLKGSYEPSVRSLYKRAQLASADRLERQVLRS